MSLLLLWNGSVQGTYNDTIPDLYLEWSPTTGPREAPAWERIPLSDIRSIDIGRGRNRELDQFQAGRMTVVLDNRDRTYDPQENSNVKPMRRIRLRAVWDTTYDLFSGFVDSWDQDYDMTQEARAVVTASDGFKVWERGELASSVYAFEVKGDTPDAWLRLGDQANSTEVVVEGENFKATVNGTPTFQTPGLIATDPDTAVAFALNTNARIVLNDEIELTNTAGFTVEFIIDMPQPVSFDNVLTGVAAGGGDFGTMAIGVDSDGTLLFDLTDAPSIIKQATSLSSVADGNPHHVVCRWAGGADLTIWVDGQDDTDGVVDIGGAFVPNLTRLVIGGSSLPDATSFEGTIDEVAFYNRTLSDARILAHGNALHAPWNGDTTGERIERLADAINWPTTDREVDDGESTLQSADISGQTALSHAQLVAKTEFGEFFFLPNGSVRFIARHNKWLPPYNDPLFVLSDDGADLAYGRLKFNYDDQLIRNRVTVGYDNGLSYTANSTASQDSFLIQSYSQTGLIGDVDSEAVDYANYILGRYDEPLLRVQGITITPQRDPDVYFPAVLSADLVYRVNVERTPQDVGSAIDLEYTIEGVSHHIEPKFWRTELQLSPADTPGAFILDSTSQGLLDIHTLGW